MMVESDEKKTPPALVAGRLEGTTFPQLLWELCRRKKTGVLTLGNGWFEKRVLIRDGSAVFASSSDPNDRLGEMLLRRGLIDLDQLERALTSLHTGKRLGALLIENGAIGEEELKVNLQQQLTDIVLELVAWDCGEYGFEEGELPGEEAIQIPHETSALILNGVRRVRSWTLLQRHVGPASTVYRTAANADELLGKIELRAGERLLIESFGGESRSINELCEGVFYSNFEIYQALWALQVLGVVEQVPGERVDELAKTVESDQGQLGPIGMAALVLELHRRARTGVLTVRRGDRERALYFETGRCVFAMSNSLDDGLLAYLLRRGVISLRDREEANKRRLESKRDGTILQEMGVLEESEVQELVREQLQELVLDTFAWEEGVFNFEERELPTDEPTTVGWNVAYIISQGIRRVRAWTRIAQGCGGIDEPQGLTDRYLEVLDAFDAGVDEWEVVNLLKTPRSPRKICRAIDLPDFRVCQILWTLRLLGAIEAREPEIDEEILADVPAPPSFEEMFGTDAVEAATSEAPERAPEPEPEPEPEPAAQASPTVAAPSEEPVELPPPLLPDVELMEALPEVEAAPVESELSIDVSVLPEEIDEILARFNAAHQIVFRGVRAEVGAGAVNFIRACCEKLDDSLQDALEQARLLPDGSWELASLKRGLSAETLEPATVDDGLTSLIEGELESLRNYAGDRRVQQLQDKIAAARSR